MKTPVLACILLPLLAPALPAQESRTLDEGSLEHCDWQMVELTTDRLDAGHAQFAVYLPKNAEEPLPWVLWLHGMNGTHRKFHSRGAPVFDRLLGQGKIPPMVFVAPSTTRRPLYMDNERSGAEESFLVEDLLRYIEATYPVRKERRGRAIMGVSMGGLGALRLGIKHKDLFCAVACHSMPVLPADPGDLDERAKRYAQWLGFQELFGDPIDPDKWRREVPAALLSARPAAHWKDLALYFDAGSKDRYGFAEPNQAFHRFLDKRKIEHTFRLVQGGGHSWGSGAVQDALKTSLPFVGKAFARPPAKAGDKR